jgi:thiamine biosynthesis lipoprotein
MMDALLSTRRRLLKGALGTLALAGCGERAASPRRRDAALHFGGETMGTYYRVTLANPGPDRRLAARAHEAVFAALDGVDRGMSLFRPDSELAQLNRHRAGEPLPLSADMFAVLAASQRVAQLTAGAFDVTVAPLVHAWGFGPARRRLVPPASSVQAHQRAVGYQALQLDPATRSAIKTRADLQADLGGIAKGHGVDLAARALDALGVEHYLIEVGGEVRSRGVNAAGVAWRIGIERPDALPPRPHYVVPLARGAMATSGDYRIYFEQDGRRYSHEIDPASAAPIAHSLCSVTVVADDCLHADALATGLIVMGPARGSALAQPHGLAAYFIERDADGRFRERATPAFTALGGQVA